MDPKVTGSTPVGHPNIEHKSMSSKGHPGTTVDREWLPVGSRWKEWGSTGEVSFDLLPRGHYVYVAWGTDGFRPLYIGKSSNFLSRMGQHSTVQPWYSETIRFELHAFDTSEAAEWAEIEAIAALDPVYNLMRRMTDAQREAHVAEKERRKRAAAARQKEAKVNRERAAKQREKKRRVDPRQVEVAERLRIRRIRHVRERPEIFTSEQLAIIRRVQDRTSA